MAGFPQRSGRDRFTVCPPNLLVLISTSCGVLDAWSDTTTETWSPPLMVILPWITSNEWVASPMYRYCAVPVAAATRSILMGPVVPVTKTVSLLTPVLTYVPVPAGVSVIWKTLPPLPP